MPPSRTERKTRAQKARWLGPSVVIIVLAGIALNGWLWFPAPHPTTIAVSPAANDHYSGSIVVAEPNRDTCRRYKLNNATGKMTDQGAGDCSAEANGSNGQQTRINAIAEGFRNK
jgi:hypothetical protein